MIRLLLVLATVVVLLAVLGLMLRGWRQRGRRQEPLLAGVDTTVPAELGEVVVPAATGLYVGTTAAGSWQDRVVAGGLGRRAAATATLYRSGAVFERQGDDPVFLTTAGLTDARVEPALAGKVLGRGGLLVLRWQAGGHEFDSGFKADDRSVYVDWVGALGAPAPDREISQ